jgi:O-antigen/teichoic acid export membrane protein
LPAVLSGILLLLQNRIGLWLTSRYLTLSDVGYLSVGLGLVERVLMVPATASNLLFPHVAAQNVLTSRAPQTVWLVRAVAGGLAGLCLGLGLLAGPLIRTLFGSQFEPAVRPFQILLVGAVFLALFQLMNSDLQGRRQSKPGAVVMMIALGVNCWLSWLLLGRYGMNGVAIASSASFIVSALLLVPAYLAASQTSLHSLVIGDGKETRLVRRLWRKALGRTG